MGNDRGYQRFKEKASGQPLFVPLEREAIVPEDPKACLLHTAVWSDLHISALFMKRTLAVLSCMEDLKESQSGFDAFLICGDIGENGRYRERQLFADALEKLPNLGRIIPATGNHDIRLRDYRRTKKEFLAFCRQVEPAFSSEDLYYEATVNGVTFLILGSEKTVFEEAYLSARQRVWLFDRLSLTAGKGKPVFVVAHQPLKDTHGLPGAWDAPSPGGSLGEQSDDVRSILKQFPDVFYVTGHLHRGFWIHTYEEVEGIHAVNVPSLGDYNKDSRYSSAGLGFLIEVYPDRVLFRPRDFFHGKYVPEWARTYMLEST
ncbi:MAG: metallophosphoesterase [Clostridia bacterium]|nr:metallophosphoesterase [Clostridia bacterium]MBR0537477.1 metallophosphoesterase [Clostridia bacterium]